MKAFRNVYVKDYDKFPYTKLNGTNILNYTGKIIFYKGANIPKDFNTKTDIVFDCDCEFGEWRKINKLF